MMYCRDRDDFVVVVVVDDDVVVVLVFFRFAMLEHCWNNAKETMLSVKLMKI